MKTISCSYESGNGIKVEQSGYLKRAPSTSSRSGELKEGEEEEDEVQVLQGSYSYTAPDGQQISLRYVKLFGGRIILFQFLLCSR